MRAATDSHCAFNTGWSDSGVSAAAREIFFLLVWAHNGRPMVQITAEKLLPESQIKRYKGFSWQHFSTGALLPLKRSLHHRHLSPSSINCWPIYSVKKKKDSMWKMNTLKKRRENNCKDPEIGQERLRGSARHRGDSGAPQGLVLVPAGSSRVEKSLANLKRTGSFLRVFSSRLACSEFSSCSLSLHNGGLAGRCVFVRN